MTGFGPYSFSLSECQPVAADRSAQELDTSTRCHGSKWSHMRFTTLAVCNYGPTRFLHMISKEGSLLK